MKYLSMVCGVILIVAITMALPESSLAQDDKVRKSLQASVTQTIGANTEVTIDFSRPGVKG